MATSLATPRNIRTSPQRSGQDGPYHWLGLASNVHMLCFYLSKMLEQADALDSDATASAPLATTLRTRLEEILMLANNVFSPAMMEAIVDEAKAFEAKIARENLRIERMRATRTRHSPRGDERST